ncbi:MAG: hypothetical protein ACXAAI_08095 [Promethearchaeota archaeon]|jgi:uncharacterized membrane protein YidH (DUF202 family)
MSGNERDKLARLRTLLALERNYLAEERTQLARVRTGLAFTLIAPSVYIFIASLNLNIPLYFLIIFYIILGFIFIRGIWTIYSAKSKLNKIRHQKEIVKEKEKQIIDNSESIQNTFRNSIEFDND